MFNESLAFYLKLPILRVPGGGQEPSLILCYFKPGVGVEASLSQFRKRQI